MQIQSVVYFTGVSGITTPLPNLARGFDNVSAASGDSDSGSGSFPFPISNDRARGRIGVL